MEEKILNLLSEEYPEIDFTASDELVDDGILDSLTITGIIATLTMEFGIGKNGGKTVRIAIAGRRL